MIVRRICRTGSRLVLQAHQDDEESTLARFDAHQNPMEGLQTPALREKMGRVKYDDVCMAYIPPLAGYVTVYSLLSDHFCRRMTSGVHHR
jgi:hypothetical protein